MRIGHTQWAKVTTQISRSWELSPVNIKANWARSRSYHRPPVKTSLPTEEQRQREARGTVPPSSSLWIKYRQKYVSSSLPRRNWSCLLPVRQAWPDRISIRTLAALLVARRTRREISPNSLLWTFQSQNIARKWAKSRPSPSCEPWGPKWTLKVQRPSRREKRPLLSIGATLSVKSLLPV